MAIVAVNYALLGIIWFNEAKMTDAERSLTPHRRREGIISSKQITFR